MSRNLNQEEKVKLRDKYEEHIYFRLVKQSCKKYESELRVFRFSPEDVFMETLNVLDDLKAPNRNNDDLYSIIWDDLFCEFRDRGENIPEEELNKAVAIVISMVTFCLALLDSMKYNGVNGKLIRLLSNKYRGYRDFHRFTELRANIIGIDELKDWLAGYMQCDTYMYDEVMDYLEEKEEVEETNDEDSKIAPSKVRAQALLEILNLCNMGTDIQDVSKISRLIGFIIGHSPEKLRQTLIKDGRSIVLKRNTHQKHVDEVNKILSDMNSKIKLECE
jgi:hypothetical protein